MMLKRLNITIYNKHIVAFNIWKQLNNKKQTYTSYILHMMKIHVIPMLVVVCHSYIYICAMYKLFNPNHSFLQEAVQLCIGSVSIAEFADPS